MHITINAIAARLGGSITVIRNLLAGFVAVDGGRHRYTVIGPPGLGGGLEAAAGRVRFVPSALASLGSLGRAACEELELPARAALEGADVMLCPAGMGVPLSPVPQVVVFQNMAPFDADVLERYPAAYRVRLYTLRYAGLLSARRARRVVFISDFSRRRIQRMLRFPEARIRRIYLGRDATFSPEARARTPEVIGPMGVRPPYLLCASQFYCYKNLVELVIGFARARPSLPANLTLVLAGAEHEADYAARVKRAIAREGLGERVQLVGLVPYDKLAPLYAGAEMCLFPSTCENFPNILIEGMACGSPTLSSRLASMPELAGDGAAYFDPFDPDDIADAIVRLWQDPAARADLAARGLERCRRYDWRATATEMLEVLAEAAA
jgi:glycosyltransferase involved in cell wall biosynthesis